MSFDFHGFMDITKDELSRYVNLLETFLVVHGCRPAAIIMISKQETIEFLESHDLVVKKYPLGYEAFVIWKKKGSYDHINSIIYEYIVEFFEAKKIDFFHMYTGKLLNYISPFPILARRNVVGKQAQITVIVNSSENTNKAIQLIPQIVLGKTNEEIIEALSPCEELLKNKELTHDLPFEVVSVHIQIKPYEKTSTKGGSRRRKRDKRRSTYKNK